jgi:polyisoprenoid-binding protein YceI
MSFRLPSLAVLGRPVLPLLAGLAASAGAFGADFDIDPVHSTVIFAINHFGISNFIGRFDKVSGKVSWDDGDPTKSSVSYSIDAGSLDTNNPKRDQHAQGPDFLDVKEFPAITFVSTGVKKTGDDTFEVAGTMTMHGVSKPLTVTVKKTGEGDDPQKNHRIGFWTTFTITRADFGVNYMAGMLGATLDVTLSTEGVQSK